jgi:hypothetical protein
LFGIFRQLPFHLNLYYPIFACFARIRGIQKIPSIIEKESGDFSPFPVSLYIGKSSPEGTAYFSPLTFK